MFPPDLDQAAGSQQGIAYVENHHGVDDKFSDNRTSWRHQVDKQRLAKSKPTPPFGILAFPVAPL